MQIQCRTDFLISYSGIPLIVWLIVHLELHLTDELDNPEGSGSLTQNRIISPVPANHRILPERKTKVEVKY